MLYEVITVIFNLYAKMSNYFIDKNSLSFFMGGDNFMGVSSDEGKNDAKTFVDLIKKEDEILLNCGIGTGKTSRITSYNVCYTKLLRQSTISGRALTI